MIFDVETDFQLRKVAPKSYTPMHTATHFSKELDNTHSISGKITELVISPDLEISEYRTLRPYIKDTDRDNLRGNIAS